MAHPVGAKAMKLVNKSPTVRWRRVKRMASVPTDPVNKKNVRSQNISWKFALNLFLPIDTTYGNGTSSAA
jgi:hypothetical protein